MHDDRERSRPTMWPDWPPSSPPPVGERLAVVVADLGHTKETQRDHARRLDRLEQRFDRLRQDQAHERRDRETRAQIKLQEKEARKGAMATGLALISVLMFVMAAWNFIGPRLATPVPPPASARVLN
jgi:hypothetical protein